MTIVTLKTFFALSIFTVILVAGWLPFKRRLTHDHHVDFPIGETLATGIFLGAGLLHMLPESQQLFLQMGYHYPLAFLLTGFTFLLFLWLEHLGKELYIPFAVEVATRRGEDERAECTDPYMSTRIEPQQRCSLKSEGYIHDDHCSHRGEHPAFALLAWLMLSIHSLVLGAALGLSHDYSLAIMLFLAIITHKWAESFAIAMQLNKSNLSPRNSMLFFLLFSLMTPLGIYIGWYYGHDVKTHSLIDPILIAISAGTFLYLGTLHGLERCVMVERCCNLRDFSFVIIGFLLMAAVARYV